LLPDPPFGVPCVIQKRPSGVPGWLCSKIDRQLHIPTESEGHSASWTCPRRVLQTVRRHPKHGLNSECFSLDQTQTFNARTLLKSLKIWGNLAATPPCKGFSSADSEGVLSLGGRHPGEVSAQGAPHGICVTLGADERGFFAPVFCWQESRAFGSEPAQASIACNPRKGTLRGMHFGCAGDRDEALAYTRGAPPRHYH
jgi:hypothetical protein